MGERKRAIRVITITSGKGGVGKTNIAANLAYVLATMGLRVMVLDADMGLANIDLVVGLAPRYNLYHFLKGEKTLEEIIVRGPGGMMILPASSGIEEMAELSRGHKLTLLDALNGLSERPDFLIIDTAAGISGNVTYFNLAAKEIVVVVTPEPASLTDAYALMKIMYQNYARKRFRILVNMARNNHEATEIFKRLRQATDRFLNIQIELLGFIPFDPKFKEAIRRQKALAEIFPHTTASRCLMVLAEKIRDEKPIFTDEGNLVFFGDGVIDHGLG
ncbi:MAG TPA: MinD/ParA family protein [Syntrophales bacterium]|nr:MinD/ParA family protein [Syntrophales bacterium]HOM06893.1 MinD/ParA family protein [Syntrophales bacterium]HON99410.1 MinD/ParA family protein [Syntrophales bacterium]HPC00553.1 MinD/ParA family protein [Syntrophales bacterium]HPQ06434.1 MinD/ParA family protein [Syntrophales bacterium]